MVDDGSGSGGCGFEVCRVGRRINAVAMFRYGGRGGEREGLGKFRWQVVEVRLRGSDYFFSRVSGSIYVVKGKMTRRTPHPPTYRRPYEGRRGICERVKYLYLVGGSFTA